MNDVNSEVLGQILLLQSTIHIMGDEKSMARFACRGLSRIPLFESVGMFIGDHYYTENGQAGIHAEDCRALFTMLSNSRLDQNERDRYVAEFGSTHHALCLQIATSFHLFGFLFVRMIANDQLEQLLPYIQNFLNLIALIIENNQQQEALLRIRENLEKTVAERTRELENANEALVAEISERKRAEERLRASEEKYRELIEGTDDLVTRVDPAGRLQFVNHMSMKILGAAPSECIGGSVFDFIHPDDRESTRTWLEETVAAGKTSGTFENRQVARNGEIHHMLWSSNFQYGSHGNLIGINGIGRDITDRKKAEQEKENLQNQLLQAQKIESIGRLAGGVAHDFNNMLGVILGHTELMMDLMDPLEPLQAELAEIKTAAKRSADLTRQLLAFARKQIVMPKVLDLNDTITGMLKMIRRLIGEDIDLAWMPGANLGPVRMDPAQIDQLIANLCINARDAISGVGKITIETENIHLDRAFCIAHPEFAPGSYVMITVSDDGCGMEKRVMDHLFEPFFTTKDVGEGTGLGLATTYGIVKQNEGVITVHSEPCKGTVFKIYLPQFSGKPPVIQTAQREERPRGSGEAVLLVEDEPAILNMTKVMLERLGYRVLCADAPSRALRLAEEHDGRIHLLMTDVIMPEMNGRDLVRKLVSLHPNIKHLFMSGYTADVIAHHGMIDEDIQFIQKPFSQQDLSVKIRTILDQ